jgi:hypothetical protein
MRKSVLFVLLVAVVMCFGVNMALAENKGDGHAVIILDYSSSLGFYNPQGGSYEVPAVIGIDYDSSLGFYNPQGGSYEVPVEKAKIARSNY